MTEPTFRCHLCRDTAWRAHWCCGAGDGFSENMPTDALEAVKHPCARTRLHAAHHYVERCVCWRPTGSHAAQP